MPPSHTEPGHSRSSEAVDSDWIDGRYSDDTARFDFGSPKIVYGRGCSDHIDKLLSPEAMARPFLLTDHNLRNAGVGDGAIAALQARGNPEIHAREPGEPTAGEVDEIAAAARDADVTAIVALGGGASMDSAKCVRVLLELGGSVRDHAGEAALSGPGSIPLLAMPTTSGTGSETGLGALYIDDETREKTAVYSQFMRPEIAISDPDLTLSVPPRTTAATGADALAQAVGPFTGPLRQPITDALAREAIRSIVAHLPRAVDNGADVGARVALAYASLMSGMAMNNTEAMADQFFDEVIGPHYGVPHGNVAGLVLAHTMQFNREAAEDRTALLAEAIVDQPAMSVGERADQVVARIWQLRQQIGLPRLEELGVSESDLPELARLTAAHYGVEMGINPRVVTEEGALAILDAVWHERSPLELSV